MTVSFKFLIYTKRCWGGFWLHGQHSALCNHEFSQAKRESRAEDVNRLTGEGKGGRAAVWILSSLLQHSAALPFPQQKGKQWLHKTCRRGQSY